MEFTINWSPQARDLLRAGSIQLDRFKCPDWDDMIASAREDMPLYVHFPLVVGVNQLAKTDWKRVDALMRDTKTPHVNLHLEPLRSALGDLDDEAVIDLCVREIRDVVARYGGEYVVLENIPYRTEQTNKFRCAIMPDVITRIIETSGCSLLLDIGHARITSNSIGMNAFDYIRALPLNRLYELHVAGIQPYTQAIHDRAMQFDGYEAMLVKYEGQNMIGRLMDHFGMDSDDDWAAFAWILDRVRGGEASTPRFVSFEYGGTGAPFGWRSERDVIARDVPRFYTMVHPVGEQK